MHEHEHATTQRATQALVGQQELKLRLDSIEAKYMQDSTNLIAGALSHAEIPRPRNRIGQTVRIATSFPRRSCKGNCECGCHRRHRSSIKSPTALEAIIGTLFVGYTGTPYIDEVCNHHPACSQVKRSITILYVFPAWFLARAVAVALSCFSASGPELNIRIINIVPSTSRIFSHASDGDVDGLKNVLRQGIGSPMDMGSEGEIPLLVCVAKFAIGRYS